MGFWDSLFGTGEKKFDNTSKSTNYQQSNKVNFKIVKNSINEMLKNGDRIEFGDILVTCINLESFTFSDMIYLIVNSVNHIYIKSDGKVAWETVNMDGCKKIPDRFVQNPAQFIREVIEHGVVTKSDGFKLKEFFEKLRYERNSKVEILSHFGHELLTTYKDWVMINGGEYYAKDHNEIYKLEDWSRVRNPEICWKIVSNGKIEIVKDNPRKTHWEHFLKLDMLKKAERDQEMKKYVDDILEKKMKYDDLQVLYGAIPSSPITDVQSFRNFCQLTLDDKKYEDYEIENYLMVLKHEKSKGDTNARK